MAVPGARRGGRVADAGQRAGGHVDAVDHDAVDAQVRHVQVVAIRRQVHGVGMRLLLPLRVDAAGPCMIMDVATYPRTARVGIPDTSTVRSATATS